MPIRTREQGSRNGEYDIDLDVIVSGMTIVVKSGVFRAKGENFTLDDDYEYVAKESEEHRFLNVYLAKEVETGSGVVVVDEEKIGDGRFPWVGSGYEPLYRLFIGNIPGNTADLAVVSWVRKTVKGVVAERKVAMGAVLAMESME